MACDFCQCGFLLPGLSAWPCIRGESVGSSVCLCVCVCIYKLCVYCIYKICKNNFSNIWYTVSNHSFFLIFTKVTTQNVISTYFFVCLLLWNAIVCSCLCECVWNIPQAWNSSLIRLNILLKRNKQKSKEQGLNEILNYWFPVGSNGKGKSILTFAEECKGTWQT